MLLQFKRGELSSVLSGSAPGGRYEVGEREIPYITEGIMVWAERGIPWLEGVDVMESPVSGRDAKGGNPLLEAYGSTLALVPGPHPGFCQ